MTRGLKLRQAGGSISATLPKDMAERLHLEAGDTVLAVETERGILLTPYDPEVEEALAIAGKVAGRYRNALRELANSRWRRSGEPRWVDRLVVEAVQFDLIREHGGMPGLRDEHALEAALARPLQRRAYRPTPTSPNWRPLMATAL